MCIPTVEMFCLFVGEGAALLDVSIIPYIFRLESESFSETGKLNSVKYIMICTVDNVSVEILFSVY
ncbi:hypothetical protein SDC9_170437 [bioreactor metagenome]|uniref:Uncharacterized protein n=1 Tax=bioreactor metagenome TaxID=1076179 RepID=A0A645GAP7_9ZZZZ